jgi:hypothetical protein
VRARNSRRLAPKSASLGAIPEPDVVEFGGALVACGRAEIPSSRLDKLAQRGLDGRLGARRGA